MAEVVSVNISERKGTVKVPVPEIELRLRHGIVGDAHAGDWHRQISLLAEESVDKLRPLLPTLEPGVFAENINTRGIDLKNLPVGTHLRIGETEVEVTQIGKECHSDDGGGGDPDRQGVPQRLRHPEGHRHLRHAHRGHLRRGDPGGRGPARR